MNKKLKLTALAALLTLAAAPMVASAEKSYPTSGKTIAVGSCTADTWKWVEATDSTPGHWLSGCNVRWTAAGPPLAYEAGAKADAKRAGLD